MTNDQLDNLKQFIAATVSQSETRLRDELTEVVAYTETRLMALDAKIEELRAEMHDGFAGIKLLKAVAGS